MTEETASAENTAHSARKKERRMRVVDIKTEYLEGRDGRTEKAVGENISEQKGAFPSAEGSQASLEGMLVSSPRDGQGCTETHLPGIQRRPSPSREEPRPRETGAGRETWFCTVTCPCPAVHVN